jgi:phosphatidylglycerophosphatase C
MTRVPSSQTAQSAKPASLAGADAAAARIVVFDFDGTITTDDTFRLFLKYYKGSVSYAIKIASLLPVFLAYSVRLIDRNKVKAHVIRKFFKGESVAQIESRADSFAKDVIPALIRPAAKNALEAAKKREKSGGESLYICSASIGPYLRAYFEPQGVDKILATELKSESNICNGEIDGYNIWGEGKIRRILAEFAPQEVNIIEAYGDSRGDRELLNAAEASFYRPFRLSPT